MSDVQTIGVDKRIQTQVLQLAQDTVAIRSLDYDRDRFDIEFGLEKGTTYNSYLIFGADYTALVDASHEKFSKLYMQTLKDQLAAAGRGVDYIVVSHTEPDHSFLVPAVLDLYPEATVVGSKVCINFLKGLTLREFKERAVKGGEKLDLGGGHELEFVLAPNLHWPDTMFTYDHATGVMYTCDAFGMHFCTEDPFDVDVPALMPHYRFYYDCLMKPNAKSVTTALRKVEGLQYNTIANGHGPILRYNVESLVNSYRDWSLAVGKIPTQVAVLYSADYGFSDRLSQTLARGITKAGVAVEMVDLLSADPQEVVMAVAASKGIVLMSPPEGDADAKTSLAAMTSALKPGSKVLVAESYGGKDDPVDTLMAQFQSVGAEVLGDALRVKDLPTQVLYQQFEEAGTDLAQALTAKDAIARKKAAMPADIAKAVGRLSSGLYIVTAAHNNARSAMVASWVSQASFEPLGLTIAVAKDRAIESMMQVGDRFVLNCLGQSTFEPLMKHFLKRFAAGADRFDGIEWFPAANGCPVLKDGIAYIECTVVSRMETPDHWVTYAQVTTGDVMNGDELTAVHHRKVGNYY
ncbi:MAG: flavoprotein [Monoraphidium minutum]|nr:MAG: flavoprotein [Monoraphidium minutum]